jgi:hypothetical protein
VFAIKGQSGFARAAIQRSQMKKKPLFIVGVDAIKSQLFRGKEPEMKYPHIGRPEFLKLARLTVEMWDQMMRDNQVSLAFGAPIPAAFGLYLIIDSVAMRIAGELAALLGRAEAAAIVLTQWPSWLDGVARAEFDDRHMFFAVGFRGSGAERDLRCASGTPTEIAPDFKTFTGARIIAVNLTTLLADMRATALAEGIDMADPVMISPAHPEYAETIREGERLHEMALKRWKKRERKRRARADAGAVGGRA